jgi:uncharacterized membrane protein (TIGR01666 family)
MMLNKPIRSTQDFLLSTYFADGLRITVGVLLPSLILAQFGLLRFGMTLSLGALCVSVVDTPGPIVHRRNAMLITTGLISVISLIIGLINQNSYITAVILVLFCFIFTLLSVYGTRAGAVGTACLLIFVLSIDDVRPWKDVLMHAALVLAGSFWYSFLSYFFYRIRPYRIVQQTLSDCILEISQFLRSKAKFYHKGSNFDEVYAHILSLQIEVHAKQDAVRDVLFKTREIVRDSTPEGRFLMLVFVDIVDLFEQIMSTYYNYKELHDQFDDTGILERYEAVILKIANELDDQAFALKTGGVPDEPTQLIEDVRALKQEISLLEKNNTEGKYNTLGIIALKNIEVNIENILNRVVTINRYFDKGEKKKLKRGSIDTEKFITRQSVDPKLMLENLTFKSATFRHALRVCVVMFVGFVISRSLDFSHSYWILLTILVISKPGFSLTKERNYQRIIGTLVGAGIAILVLNFIEDKNVLFVILLVCMIGCYSFQRKNYVVSVVFMTPYVIVLFQFLGMGGISVATERIYDTLIGSGIAFVASYFLFPTWEHERLKDDMLGMLIANCNYFNQVNRLFIEQITDFTNYKLARKEVYVATANLASLFQRMFSEPKSKQFLIKELHQFTALNHLLSSYVATLALYYKEHDFRLKNIDFIKPVSKNTDYLITQAQDKLNNPTMEKNNVPLVSLKDEDRMKLNADEEMILQQFVTIQKVAYDIYKLTEKMKV